MSAIATSNLSRNLLFEYAAKLAYNSSRYFRKVQYMAKKLNYDYTEACRIVGESTRETEPKAILLRMSGALASGENESDFLARESASMSEVFGDEYERSLESLRKWTDAYVAVIISASLVVVVSVVSMLIFPMNMSSIALMTFLMLATTLAGTWIMYRSSPKEIKTIASSDTSAAQNLAKRLFKFVSVPLLIVVVLAMIVLHMDLGVFMILCGIVALPPGVLIIMDDRRIDKYDSDIAGFLRSLGGITKAIGSTVNEALGRLDFGALGSLKKPVKTLNKSISLGMRPDFCWQRFVANTGSEHINRTVRIFWDSLSLGGDPLKVGNLSAMFAQKVALMRAKRKLVASTFTFTSLLIHATIAMLLVGIYQILLNFSKLLQTSNMSEGGMEGLAQLPTFQFFTNSGAQLQMLNFMVTAMLIMLTIVDAFTIKTVEGGHNLKICFYIGLTLIISGLVLILLPGALSGIFGVIGTAPTP